ncbi:MAG TPA: glycosyltransferase family 2 protein [Xanthomonadaceae bacterium]|jgi:glycosyltransferase involved in cell wall biosynthesis|nr:glycosyltransferase family 2 protein [Xanthomonadaceae bacterium]
MSAASPLSGVVTTFNNAGTLDACLASLAFCDEIVVLDSNSTDATVAIAQRHGARVHAQPFAGYAAQKQAAIDLAQHDWCLLLDADECLVDPARAVIERELAAPRADGYRLPRREWLFWRWVHPGCASNWQLRLFRRSRSRMNQVPVHAEPAVDGRVFDLRAPLRHRGEADIAARVDKINRYTTGMVEHKRARGTRFVGLRMLLYPWVAFARMYFVKRYFLNGWAGFTAARVHAFYAFLKYAKLHESGRTPPRD